MEKYSLLAKENLSPIKNWFTRYLEWVTSHPYGIEERDTKNNHATCWVMQVAVFAKLVNNESIAAECRNRFKNILLPFQMDKDGSFPLELKRSKPFGYSLFNLDAMATIAQTLSQPGDDLWNYSLSDGRSLKKGIDFLFPYVLNKQKWPYSPDVMYWEEWPIAQPFLLFGFLNYNNPLWYKVWKKLDHDPTVDEIVRNFPIRNPLLWIEKI
jgi:Alginate lyase